MEKSFPSQEAAFDTAKEMGLTCEQSARQITTTPKGQFSLYDEKRGEVVKSDRWRPPDFRLLIKVALTEQGRSEVSCETRPTHFTFANQVGVQTDEGSTDGTIPNELARAIQSHLWLANLEMSSGNTPTMSSTSKLPQQPHPDKPTIMTWHQLEHAQNAIVEAHKARDVSGMLKGVVSNMHLLAKFS